MKIFSWLTVCIAAIIVHGCNKQNAVDDFSKVQQLIKPGFGRKPFLKKPTSAKIEAIPNVQEPTSDEAEQGSEKEDSDQDDPDPQEPDPVDPDDLGPDIVDDDSPIDIKAISKKLYDLLIIGGGSQAVAILAQIILQKRELLQGVDTPYSILIVEKNFKLGSGYPYNGAALTQQHVLNIPAYAVDITNWCDPICENSDFVEWYRSKRKRARTVEIDLEVQFWYTPKRSIVGKYLEESFVKFKKELNDGQVYTVEAVTKTTAIDIDRDADKIFVVQISTQQSGDGEFLQNVRARDVIVATGHWDKIRHPFQKGDNYVKSPWPAPELIETIPEGVHVVVLGTSQSGVDATLTLAGRCGTFTKTKRKVVYTLKRKECKKFKIFMYSRSGKLPSVQGLLSKTRLSDENGILARLDDMKHESERAGSLSKAVLKLDEVFELVLKELAKEDEASAKYLDLTAEEYFAKFDEDTYTDPKDIKKRLQEDIKRAKKSFKKHQPIYPQNFWFDSRGWIFDDFAGYFPAEDHIRFWGSILSSLLRVGLPMPLCNAEKLLALMEKGHLEVKSTEGCEFEPYTRFWSKGVQLKCKNDKKPKATYDYLVDARGQDGLIREDESELTQSMLRNNLSYVHEIIFSDEAVAQEHAAKYKDAYGKEITGNVYTAQGATITPGTHKARPVVHRQITATNGEIYPYLSGPYLFGQIPIPRNLRTVVVGANCAVNNILNFRFDKLVSSLESIDRPKYRTCILYNR